MRRILILAMLLLGNIHYLKLYSQRIVVNETFDATPIAFTSQPSTSGNADWSSNSAYYVSYPKSYLGTVPQIDGDSVILVTPVYDFYVTNEQYVYLLFNHICKVSSDDIARIEYKEDNPSSNWQVLPVATYEGSGNYTANGFNAASYSLWNENDILTQPKQSWWKQEKFNMQVEAGYSRVQFRFIIKKGSVSGSNFSYGWLIDNIQIIASTFEINIPEVNFIGSYVKDTVYSTGPFEINATVKSTSSNPIHTPYLKYTKVFNNTTVTGSIMMTASGNSTWTGTLPQFQVGTTVFYSITGTDGNYSSTIYSNYTIERPTWTGIKGNYYIGDPSSTLTTTYAPFTANIDWSWSRLLITSGELDAGMIETVSFYPATWTRTTVMQNQKLYMKLVSSTALTSAYTNQDTSGATLVWSGDIVSSSVQAGQPLEIKLDVPFIYPANTSLLLFWMNENAARSGASTWKATSTSSTTKTIYMATNTAANYPASNGTTTSYRPNMNFYMVGAVQENNSVGLVSIDSPITGEVKGGISTPVTVTIENRGENPLSAVTISWSVNGVQMPDTTWTTSNPLEWDFREQITVGDYIPGLEKNDTILVSVSMPNGVTDPVTKDNALTKIIYGCPVIVEGRYVIGAGEDFETLQAARDYIESSCYPTGDIYLALKAGRYKETWNFADFGPKMGNYKLWITSEDDNADSVIIVPMATNANALTLNNTSNFGISHITLNVADTGYNAVSITGSCDNIGISHCKILSRPTTSSSSYNAIVKASGTGTLTNTRINNNTIDGGVLGLSIYAGTTDAYGSLTIDSNTITNAYNYALRVHYADVNFSHNTITSRASNSTYFGADIQYVNGVIAGNKITSSSSLTSHTGLNIAYCGKDSLNRMQIYNNQLIYTGGGGYGGIFITSSFADIMHNSTYGTLTSYNGYGLMLESGTPAYYNIKNNIFTINPTHASMSAFNYPVYITSAVLSRIDIDYNNYYSTTDVVGIVGSAVYTSLEAWKAAVSSDSNSTFTNPSFEDITSNLNLTEYNGFQAPLLSSVSTDINGENRLFTATKGAYQKPTPALDVELVEILDWDISASAGSNADFRAVVRNVGQTTISSISMGWKYNGTNEVNLTINKTLLTGEYDTIALPPRLYAAGYNDLTVWADSINFQKDDLNTNDTLSLRDYLCENGLSGTLTVGKTAGNFVDLEEAFTILYECGLAGPTTFAVEPGLYAKYVTLDGQIPRSDATNVLTITSTTSNRDDVILQANSGTVNQGAFNLGNVSNVILKDIQIAANPNNTYAKGITFSGSCSNIEINNCKITSNTTSLSALNSDNHIALSNLTANTFTLDDIRIINSHISGGAYGIRFAGNTFTNMSIENNTIDSVDNYGIYLTNTTLSGFSKNEINQRRNSNASPLAFTGAYFDSVSGDILSNKFSAINGSSAIQTTNYNGIIANNEILHTEGKGINIGPNTQATVAHNSILMKGESVAMALYIAKDNNIQLNLQNNNLLTKTNATDYPVYIESAANVSNYTIDYNNYYSQKSPYIGYVGANIASMTAFRTATGQDAHSVLVNPIFTNESASLKLLDSVNLGCPVFSSVLYDIEDSLRGSTRTVMGAYHIFAFAYDIALLEMTSPTGSLITSNVSTDIKVKIYNAGSVTLTDLNIHYSANGEAVQTYPWAGALLPRATSGEILIGSFIPNMKDNTVQVYISDPNGTFDQQLANDTLTTVFYGCLPTMKGSYTVGSSPTDDFNTIAEAILSLQTCGVAGAVSIEIESGTYSEPIVLTSPLLGASATNRVTFTSQSGNALDVIYQMSDQVVTLGDVNHVTFSNLTFECRSSHQIVSFIADCEDIEISNCILNSDTTATVISGIGNNAICIYMPNTVMLRDIRIVNNILDGGYANIYIGATTSNAEIENITISGNTMSNGYYYGIYAYHVRNLEISNNFITDRKYDDYSAGYVVFYGIESSGLENALIKGNTFELNNNTLQSIYGIRVSSTGAPNNNVNIIANKIYTTNRLSMTTYGISLGSINIALNQSVQVVNNEIHLTTSGTTQGIYALTGTHADIMHNSIYIDGTGATNNGIYLIVTANTYRVMNNNIDMTAPAANPIYANGDYFGSGRGFTYIDNNNLSATRFGYAGGIITTKDAWQATVTTDSNPRRQTPIYHNSAISLELSDTTGLTCPALSNVGEDILGMPRFSPTLIGAYGLLSTDLDAGLMAFIDIPQTGTVGDVINPKVIIRNTGNPVIIAATIDWEFNKNPLNSPSFMTKSLSLRDNDTVALSTPLILTSGENILRAFISSVNGGKDSIQINDTLSFAIYVCDSALYGTYSVGTSGDINNLDELTTILKNCGVAGATIFELETGTYPALELSFEIPGVSQANTITFTSSAKDSTTVLITSSSASVPALLLQNATFLRFEDITIQTYSGSTEGHAIRILRNCNDIIFNRCILKASTTATTANTSSIINKIDATGMLNNFTVCNSVIEGGYNGIYIYGGASTTVLAENILIENNTILNQHASAIEIYYTNVTVKNNKILGRSTSAATWRGISITGSNPTITGNKINGINTALGDADGIYVTTSNHSASKGGVCWIANNEVILSSAGTTSGIQIYNNSNLAVYHNSIYITATAAANGIYARQQNSNSYTNNMIYNNNVVMAGTSTTAFPIRYYNGTYCRPPYFKADYNNYLSTASTKIGYAGSNYDDIPSLTAYTGGDSNSVTIYPSFVDSSKSLLIDDATDLLCFRNMNVSADIDGNSRGYLTTKGAYALHVFEGIDLALQEIVEPKVTKIMCSPDYVTVKFAINNIGGQAIDFSQNNLRLEINVTGAQTFTMDSMITTGTLALFATDTFVVTTMLDVSVVGDYYLQAILYCNGDTIYDNNELLSFYSAPKIALPYNEEFSTSNLTNLTVTQKAGVGNWTVEQGTGGYIDPYYGTGKLVFEAPNGTTSWLSTAQLQLNKTTKPMLEFWYAHSDENPSLSDYTIVYISTDGGATRTLLFYLNRYDASYSTPTWVKYDYDLSLYVDDPCVMLIFEGNSYGGTQYIDRINISSQQNVALTEVVISPYSVCDLKGKSIGVVLSNETGQNVDFSVNRTSLVLEITDSKGQNIFSYPLTTGILNGLSSMTIPVVEDAYDFLPGNYTIKAYLSPSIDNTTKDNTLDTMIVVNPNFTVRIHNISDNNNSALADIDIKQQVTIKNTGNMPFPQIDLILSVDAEDLSPAYHFTATGSTSDILAPEDSITITFNNPYTTPWSPDYRVHVLAHLYCDSALVSKEAAISEYVDIDNLTLISIDKPSGPVDTVGTNINIEVTLENKSDAISFSNIAIHARIEDSKGNTIIHIPEIISNTINPLSPESHVFNSPYTVPNDSIYYIIILIDKQDNYQEDDTIRIKRTTYNENIDLVEFINPTKISMRQNVPNPANNSTIINYSISEAGEIIFRIHSVNGQLLYNKAVESESGTNSIEINTSNLSAGIYLYSMEFNGQRITKRMSIKR